MFDVRVIVRNIRVLMMVSSLAIPGWASGAEIHWVPQQDKGFTVMVPSINVTTLLNEMDTLKNDLRHDEVVLASQVEQKRFTSDQKVLSAILPGGLLFAAIKQGAYTKAVHAHENVVAELKEVSKDILALGSGDATVAVANR